MPALSPASIKSLGQWFADQDTGISSEAMATIAMGAKKSKLARFDAPHDPADFGRCYRLVQAVPELREHFPRIGRMVPAFAEILKEWDSLCALYLQDLPSGRSDALYRRIKELRGDCKDHPVLMAA